MNANMAVKKCCSGAKQSRDKKSIFGFRHQILFLTIAVCFVASAAADTPVSCANVKSIFDGKEGILTSADIQDSPNSDVGGLCLNQGCCSASARSRLTQVARNQLEGSLRSELNKLAEVLANRARRFDEFFRKLLQESREEFHAMFKRTYGMIYEQHSYLFEQLFEQLERYYSRGDTNLDNMIESFFGILYQKMFTVLNSQYTFDEKYLKCVSEHMRDTQPFEDVPNKLSVQLRRAFVATRTFHKALRSGAEIVKNMLQVGITNECVNSYARLRFCGSCGDAQPLACSRYCHNVLRGCLPAHADLAQQWDAYVDAVEKVADRLLGPFNIVMVVEPIDIKISEAIMNFQEHNQDISQKIFTGCGKPVLGGGGGSGPFFAPERTKRAIDPVPDFDWHRKANDFDDFEIEESLESLVKRDPLLYSLSAREGIDAAAKKLAEQAKERDRFLQYMRGDLDAEEYDEHERQKREAAPEPASSEVDYRSYGFEGKRGKKGKKPSKMDLNRDNDDWGSPALERIVRETRARVRNSRRYWAHLPYLLCSDRAAPPAPSAPCFNGTHVASYTLAAAGEGTTALASNPEVRGTATGASVVSTQQEALKVLTARLKDAYNGVEVKWSDNDDLQSSASNLDLIDSAGSGSGSGDGDDLPDDDEDRNREDVGTDYPGSGQGPTDDDSLPPDVEPESNPLPPASEVPYTPPYHPDITERGPDVDIDQPEEPIVPEKVPEVVKPKIRDDVPVKGSATRPSLDRALFTYALPVVCAWFGSMVTDLF